MSGKTNKPEMPSDLGFWIGAQAFLDAAQAAHIKLRDPKYSGMVVFPVIFLYFRAIELALKACLQKHDVPEKEIIGKLGHKLSELADRAEAEGALGAMNIKRNSLSIIDAHSADYNDKWFEYPPKFWGKIPEPDELAEFAESFVESVRAYLK